MVARAPLRGEAPRALACAVAFGHMAAGLLTACGGRASIESSPGTDGSAEPSPDAGADADASFASITGSIEGRPLSAVSTVAWVDPQSGTLNGAVVVYFSDAELTCDTSTVARRGATQLDLYVFDYGHGTLPGPGTYQVLAPGESSDGGMFASAWPHLYDEACAAVPLKGDQAISGTFTITRISPNVEGSFSFNFADGLAQGTFSAPPCPADAGTSQATCL